MAVAWKGAGTGAVTEASGGSLAPACPATVDANDILIAHVAYEGTTTAPVDPSGWTPLGGPYTVETAYRHWIYGKIAAGTEDGATVGFGTPAVTTLRVGRIYSFSGWVSGTIADNVPAASFAHLSHATDPQMPTVITTVAGSRAVACIFQADDNAIADATGATGGTWAEPVAEYIQAATTPDTCLALQTCIPTADPGTVTGGSVATVNDPCGVIGFEIRPSLPVATATGAAPLPALQSAGTGTIAVAATGAISLPVLASAGTATVAVAATGAVTLPVLTAAGTGTVTDQPVLSDGVVGLPALAAAGTAAVAVAATGAASLPALTAAGTATVAVAATGDVILPVLTAAGEALVTDGETEPEPEPEPAQEGSGGSNNVWHQSKKGQKALEALLYPTARTKAVAKPGTAYARGTVRNPSPVVAPVETPAVVPVSEAIEARVGAGSATAAVGVSTAQGRVTLRMGYAEGQGSVGFGSEEKMGALVAAFDDPLADWLRRELDL